MCLALIKILHYIQNFVYHSSQLGVNNNICFSLLFCLYIALFKPTYWISLTNSSVLPCLLYGRLNSLNNVPEGERARLCFLFLFRCLLLYFCLLVYHFFTLVFAVILSNIIICKRVCLLWWHPTNNSPTVSNRRPEVAKRHQLCGW